MTNDRGVLTIHLKEETHYQNTTTSPLLDTSSLNYHSPIEYVYKQYHELVSYITIRSHQIRKPLITFFFTECFNL